jgi:hypothetical protein
MINVHSTHLASDIVTHMIEQLIQSLVTERNVHASKNIMRVLAVLVDHGCLASGWFSQTVIQLLDECLTGAAGKVGQAEEEIILETIMAGLMVATGRLQREVALDYGSILESLKKIFAARDARLTFKAQALAPVKKPLSKDLLSQLWEGFQAYNETAKKQTLLYSYAQSY